MKILKKICLALSFLFFSQTVLSLRTLEMIKISQLEDIKRISPFFSDYVEVTDGRVAVCRDAVRGKCSRPMCKYYHIPVTLPPSK